MTSSSPSARAATHSASLHFLERERERIDRALLEVSVRGVAEYPLSIREPAEYALSTAGKRLRPLLCILAYSTAGEHEIVPDAMYRLACALEIVHTYSLVHDDLPCMDDDDLRRGRPTVHKVYGNARATLAGATLLPLAIRVLDAEGRALHLPTATRAALVLELTRAAGSQGMVGGQLLDLEGERRPISGKHLEDIHHRKTGALLTSALRIGAIAHGSTEDLLRRLTAYGRALGLAFQIADDLLDVEGESHAIGKTAGRDMQLDKASYPSLYGTEGARKLARQKAEEAKEVIRPLRSDRLEALADYVIERRK